MDKKLIFEIGTEELPSSSVYEGANELKVVLGKKLERERITFSSIYTYGTPRRLTAYVKGVKGMQDSHKKVVTGPPKKIAFEPSGKPSKAVIGFARSLDLDVSQLEEIETDRGIYMGKNIVEEGRPAIEILPGLLRDCIGEINFSKQMAWGDYDFKFARPIRWILALLGKEVIGLELENLRSQRFTYGLRNLDKSLIEIKDAGEYMKALEKKGNVIVDCTRRKSAIEQSIQELEERLWNNQKKVLLDRELLDEVVNLVEYPHVSTGTFDPKYLYIPRDILIKAIEYHQKYFAVVDDNRDITTSFVIVQNGKGDERSIVKGNQRVLEARLSDATFFYEEDKKQDFSGWLEKLKGVIFYTGIGSMHDKVSRLKKIVAFIADKLDKKEVGLILRAAQISKCDLVTNMVVEFPQLQGIVGREYAKERGEDQRVADAVFEHYLPRFAQDTLPGDDIGTILSLADKMDTICGMFILGNMPTGSEDPFALRRKASGIVSSILEKDYPLPLADLIDFVTYLYEQAFGHKRPRGLKSKILDFILARYRFNLEKQGKRIDIAESVIGTGISSISGINKRYNALEKYFLQKEIELLANPMVRCQNITKGKEIPELDPSLFNHDDEKRLYKALVRVGDIVSDRLRKEEYFGILIELEGFGKIVDRFFDQVLVMDKDPKIRGNRISLVKAARDLYMNIADFSKLVIEG